MTDAEMINALYKRLDIYGENAVTGDPAAPHFHRILMEIVRRIEVLDTPVQ